MNRCLSLSMQQIFRSNSKRMLGAAVVAIALLSGCASNGPEQTAAKVDDLNPSAVDRSGRTGGIAQTNISGGVLPELTDPKSVLSKRSVYFDYDQYVIKDEYKGLVQAHARFLAAHPEYRMLIQGNADERGSREYNLALGQKRADALRKALQLLGAKEAQIESVSLGKEKPKNEGHDEAAWAENRRDDMLYRDANKPSGEF